MALRNAPIAAMVARAVGAPGAEGKPDRQEVAGVQASSPGSSDKTPGLSAVQPVAQADRDGRAATGLLWAIIGITVLALAAGFMLARRRGAATALAGDAPPPPAPAPAPPATEAASAPTERAPDPPEPATGTEEPDGGRQGGSLPAAPWHGENGDGASNGAGQSGDQAFWKKIRRTR